MESVIDITVVFRFFMPPGGPRPSIRHGTAWQIEHRCCASVERSARTRLKIIGRHPHRFELEMRMLMPPEARSIGNRGAPPSPVRCPVSAMTRRGSDRLHTSCRAGRYDRFEAVHPSRLFLSLSLNAVPYDGSALLVRAYTASSSIVKISRLRITVLPLMMTSFVMRPKAPNSRWPSVISAKRIRHIVQRNQVCGGTGFNMPIGRLKKYDAITGL